MSDIGDVPQEARSIVLYKHDRSGVLIACEPVEFLGGATGIDTVLRRAHICGQVKVGGDLELGDYFADILDDKDDIITNVMLDRGSYRALKTHWMRTRINRRSAR